jgi:hypothetical protein
MLFFDCKFRELNRTISLRIENEYFRLLLRFEKSAAIFSVFRESGRDPNAIAISAFCTTSLPRN